MGARRFNDEIGEGLRNNNFDISMEGLFNVMGEIGFKIDYSLIDRALLTCKSAPIPDNETELIDIEYNGLVYKKVGKKTYGEISLTFYNAPNQIAHDIFTALSEAQSYYDENGKLITNTYPFSFKLIQYDTKGNPIAGWKVINAVLGNISNPDFDKTDTSSIQEFTVSLNPLMVKKIPFGELGNVLEEIYAWYDSISNLNSNDFEQTFK